MHHAYYVPILYHFYIHQTTLSENLYQLFHPMMNIEEFSEICFKSSIMTQTTRQVHPS